MGPNQLDASTIKYHTTKSQGQHLINQTAKHKTQTIQGWYTTWLMGYHCHCWKCQYQKISYSVPQSEQSSHNHKIRPQSEHRRAGVYRTRREDQASINYQEPPWSCIVHTWAVEVVSHVLQDDIVLWTDRVQQKRTTNRLQLNPVSYQSSDNQQIQVASIPLHRWHRIQNIFNPSTIHNPPTILPQLLNGRAGEYRTRVAWQSHFCASPDHQPKNPNTTPADWYKNILWRASCLVF